MKKTLLISLIAFLAGGCRMIQKNTDRKEIKYALNHQEQLHEAVSLVVAETYEKGNSHLELSKITEEKTKAKLSIFGSRVTVEYRKAADANIPDSIVTFKKYSIWGVTEIIYDFASAERSFSENHSNSFPFYFKKIAPRIYFRRREFPMM